jgi:hypothetical protein
MRSLSCLALCGVGLLSWSVPGVAGGKKDDPKGTLVVLDGLKSLTPADWLKDKPANRLRSHQFRLPKAKGDKEDAELSVSPDQRGPAAQALKRWQDLFEPPAGKTIEEASRVENFKLGAVKVAYLDVHGTYLKLSRPLAPKNTAVPLPNYRMLAVFFETPEGAHFIRLVGPAATVEQHKKGFDGWLKAFK